MLILVLFICLLKDQISYTFYLYSDDLLRRQYCEEARVRIVVLLSLDLLHKCIESAISKKRLKRNRKIKSITDL